MPVEIKHRQRDAHELPHYNACVARTVKPPEVKTNIKAQAAMEMEWRRLRHVPRRDGKVRVWDEALSRNGPQCGAMQVTPSIND